MHGCRRGSGSGLQGRGCLRLLLLLSRRRSSDSSQTAVLVQTMRPCGGGSSKMTSGGAGGSDSCRGCYTHTRITLHATRYS